MRSRSLGLGSAAALLAVTLPAAPALAGWHTLDTTGSPTGDWYGMVQHKGETVRFRIRSFVNFGQTDICVRKVHRRAWHCHTVELAPTSVPDIYQATIRWQGNYPTRGHAKRLVRFLPKSAPASFRP
ncbi:MAG: hypothetical protein U0R64_08085 [Candidatus Nanopelagicales bacterium]